MKLNHLNLSVADVANTAELFEEFLGFWRAKRKREDVLILLFDESGLSLILSKL